MQIELSARQRHLAAERRCATETIGEFSRQPPIINYTLFTWRCRSRRRAASAVGPASCWPLSRRIASQRRRSQFDRNANQQRRRRQHCNYRPIVEPRFPPNPLLGWIMMGLRGGGWQQTRSTCCRRFWLPLLLQLDSF